LGGQCDESELLWIKVVLYRADDSLSQKLETLYQRAANHYLALFLIFIFSMIHYF
jgi:hypothetical protein